MQQEVYRLLREAQAGGATVFFSSHIISEVEAMAERVAIIREGVIAEEAEPGQLVSMALRRVRVRFQAAGGPRSLGRGGGRVHACPGQRTSVTCRWRARWTA